MVLLAGEASGDAYGAALARELTLRVPGVRMVGYGGESMRAAGVDLIADLGSLAIMGVAEVLPRLPGLLRLRWATLRLLARGGVSLVVPIDFPGLNLSVAAAARRRGIPVLYYVPPKVWAWGRGRAEKLARHTDAVACVLPFEEGPLRRAGVDARYVGHPLLDREDEPASRDDFLRSWGLDARRRLLAVLPGSRPQEVRRLLPPFVEAARIVTRRRPDVLPVLARAPGLHPAPFLESGLATVTDTRALLLNADAALVKSGTATLEAALEGCPLVIGYAVSPLTWRIARRVLRTPWVGLPNLVLGERVVPEFLQDELRPEALADELEGLLDPEGPARRGQLEALARVREALGPAGATGRVADLAVSLMQSARA